MKFLLKKQNTIFGCKRNLKYKYETIKEKLPVTPLVAAWVPPPKFVALVNKSCIIDVDKLTSASLVVGVVRDFNLKYVELIYLFKT